MLVTHELTPAGGASARRLGFLLRPASMVSWAGLVLAWTAVLGGAVVALSYVGTRRSPARV